MTERNIGDRENIIVSSDIRMELEIIPATGYYDTKNEFLRDAIRTLLAARPDLRIAIASELYKKEKISLSKASDIVGENIETVKKLFFKRRIKLLRGSTTKEEIENEVKRFQ